MTLSALSGSASRGLSSRARPSPIPQDLLGELYEVARPLSQIHPWPEDQLVEIGDHLSRTASPTGAAHYVASIKAHCDGLAPLPIRSHSCIDLLADLRIIKYYRHTVIAFLGDAETQAILVVDIC